MEIAEAYIQLVPTGGDGEELEHDVGAVGVRRDPLGGDAAALGERGAG